MLMQLTYPNLNVPTMVFLHLTAYNYFLELYHVTAEEFANELSENGRISKAMPNQGANLEKPADEEKNWFQLIN